MREFAKNFPNCEPLRPSETNYAANSTLGEATLESKGTPLSECPKEKKRSPGFAWWMKQMNTVSEGFGVTDDWQTTHRWKWQSQLTSDSILERIEIRNVPEWLREDTADPIDWEQVSAVWVAYPAVDSFQLLASSKDGDIMVSDRHVALKRGDKMTWLFSADSSYTFLGLPIAAGFVDRETVWVLLASNEISQTVVLLEDGKQRAHGIHWHYKEDIGWTDIPESVRSGPIRLEKDGPSVNIRFEDFPEYTTHFFLVED